MKKNTSTDNSSEDKPAENEGTVNRTANENVPLTKKTADLNSTNKAYANTGSPDEKTSGTEKDALSKYKNWGSEFGADPEAAGKLNTLKDENTNVTQKAKEDPDDKGSHSR